MIIMAAEVERVDLTLLREVGDGGLLLHLKKKKKRHLIQCVVVLTLTSAHMAAAHPHALFSLILDRLSHIPDPAVLSCALLKPS